MKRVLDVQSAACRQDMRFQAQHPLVTLVYYIGVFMALFLFNSLCYTAVILAWMLLLACRTAGGRKSLRLLFGAVLFGGILLLINPLVNSEGLHILFYLGERPITLESLLYGTHNLLLIVALLLVFPSLNLLMDSERILFLFSRFLQASALILTMAMRFVPLLTRRARELLQIYRQEGGGLLLRLRHTGKLLGALLDWTMEEGMQSSRTLRARGYGGRNRTFYSAFRFTVRDAGSLCLLTVAAALLMGLRFFGAGKWMYFPAFTAPLLNGIQAGGLGLLCFFCGYPFLLEAGSRIFHALETHRRRTILV
ncbi:MAG: energy-coupling factor transporter transmembrane component T [Candidatus Fimivicinus sp.]|nr:energy-coupling factor transporter transmembrane component T [Candidatus Fimivicinus sp.]